MLSITQLFYLVICVYANIYIGTYKKRCRRKKKTYYKNVEPNKKGKFGTKWKVFNLHIGLNIMKKMSIHITDGYKV